LRHTCSGAPLAVSAIVRSYEWLAACVCVFGRVYPATDVGSFASVAQIRGISKRRPHRPDACTSKCSACVSTPRTARSSAPAHSATSRRKLPLTRPDTLATTVTFFAGSCDPASIITSRQPWVLHASYISQPTDLICRRGLIGFNPTPAIYLSALQSTHNNEF